MATPVSTSVQQQQQSYTGSGNTTTGNMPEQHGGAHHQRHHAIARVASAHGPRDSILSFQHHHHQQQQQQQQQSQSQQQQYHRHHSPSPLVVGSAGPSRLIGGSAPPALCSGVGQSPSIALPPPPQYEQAIAAAVAAANDDDGGTGTGNAGAGANMAKFANRRSPESRTPIQAVLPMQPSLVREVIPSPTSIPDECQVVKQLVREMASGQLSVLGNVGSGFSNSDGAAVVSQAAASMHAIPPPPPAYSQHQFQAQQQQQSSRQQQQLTNVASAQHQKIPNAQQQHFGASSTAHPLLDGGTNSVSSAAISDNAYAVGHVPPQSPKETNVAGQRMSLSHPDLSRLQNLHLSAWQGHSAASAVVDATAGTATAPGGGLHNAAALNAMTASFAAFNSPAQQLSAMKTQQRPASALQQQFQQQQLLLQQQQQQQQHHQLSTSVPFGVQALAGRSPEHGAPFLAGHAGSAAGGAIGYRQAYLQGLAPLQGTTVTSSHQYEVVRPIDGSSPYVQGPALNAMLVGMHPQSAMTSTNVSAPLPNVVQSSSAHDFGHRSSMEPYEADLEANAFTRMINLLKEENKKLRTELDSYMKKAFKLQQLELQYQKLYREYEELVQRQEKREELEQQMANKMRQENARLRDLNIHLRDKLENMVAQMAHLHADDAEDAELRHELMRREMMMAQLITQNKELVACKERQEIELEAQRQTLDDQRSHIQILDKALTNAQEKNLRLDEECKKKSMYVQRADQLQRTVQQLQEAIQKNEENHKRVRAQLEAELAQLQVQKKDTQVKKTSSSRCLQEFDDTLAKLKRELRDKDDQLAGQQQELLQWQNMYYEEKKKRETALDEAADSKDARIRLLEESSDKAEKMAESAQVETKRYLDDLRTSKARAGDLETKVQNLEARIAEKDAMINVLRRRQSTPFGDSNNARSAEATLTEPYDYNPKKEMKNRLEIAKRRLLQSPSPSRYAARLYQRHGHKFTSIDASFGLDDTDYGSLGRTGRRSKASSSTHGGNSSPSSGARAVTAGAGFTGSPDISAGRIQHNRTQSSCDSYLSPSAGTVGAASASALGAFKQREIFTLPTRRSRTKLLTTEQVKSVRPRSADEHLLNRPEGAENAIEDTATSSAVGTKGKASRTVSDFSTGKMQAEAEDNGEELWHV